MELGSYLAMVLCVIQLQHCFGFNCGRANSLICAGKQLTTFPSWKCSSRNNTVIQCLILSRNRITAINDDMFTDLKTLETLRLNKNRLTTIKPGAFDTLTSLRELDLSENFITHITTLLFTKLKKLEKIHLNGNAIVSIQPGSFDGLNVLYKLDLEKNKLNEVPRYNGSIESAVTTLNLAYNPISSLRRATMKSYPHLTTLRLQNTEVSRLPSRIFKHNAQLQNLYLTNTPLKHIYEDAFDGIKLDVIFLQGTLISHLPGRGMEHVSELDITNTKDLWELPFKSFKRLKEAFVEYHFHCCLLRTSVSDMEDVGFSGRSSNFTPIKVCPTLNPSTKTTLPILTTQRTTTTKRITSIFDVQIPNYHTNHENVSVTFAPDDCVDVRVPPFDRRNKEETPKPFICQPSTDEFNPCEDLLGSTALRVCTWLVLVLAILGNGLQLIVLLTSKRNTTMYQVLMCNLSVANLFMGIYLAMLAIIDAQSLGEYQNHARAWQYGPGCNIAGFLSILSTELAVFILTVITMERYFTIVHPLKIHMHLTTKQVNVLMIAGWLTALTLATLPLVGFSSYQRVAICLPFDVSNSQSKAYVTFLLITNGVTFVTVLFCYTRMFLSLGGNTCSSATRIESRVARKMAMLVLSNFACWFPIALFSFIAIYGTPVIDVPASKFLLVFIYPINSFTNPYLYALGTKHFQLDCLDLLKNFSMCESTIDKLRGRILHQLASLPHVSNSRGYMTSSRTSVNSSMYRAPSPQSNLNSPISRSPTNTRNGSFPLRFLPIPKMNLPICKDDEYSDSIVGCSNACISNDPLSDQLLTNQHDQQQNVDHHREDDDETPLEIFRRLSAREVILGGTAINKNKSQRTSHLDYSKENGVQNLSNQTDILLTQDCKTDSSKKLPVLMVTSC